ncbi:Protein translocase subunit SecG (SecG) (PDB:2AKH) [Commensalibacter communis]|uniref:Protein-export membrane protein SecG n=1 Tax=Commensalibacter communis TaxID=2972786 RepID=A0A9W4TMW8_9PROT|nr:preprotein translocase subunit SecG [Commensalibacter communis]CAI3926844.1 Protein translocase subunit SecG (SecG) (PDB:2AKH) [Commensalibacter communis]CAI3927460.1 Protein translocase subunit SecG (SecG) (PDB:2AKH) [Commensalibacter communis]CAI3933991.1 Protein translocase subunit SecG (SecG) (PDB:2AKH) [Commensalibacter communis]CAI3935321.1 Protein translocase subunit SecG (SecG) (PDB:2AKH) [Commensalibacter communis]CAI3935574.1 Protein translocase subunit SecG (SecG) (PDB:2AKH) [Com
MMTILLIVQLLVTLALIGVVLIQRSEGGGLGIGSSQGMGSFMTGRGTTNLLTRTTGILAAAFMVLCIVIAILYKNEAQDKRKSLLDIVPQQTSQSQPKPAAQPQPQPQQTEKTTPNK